MKFLQCITYEIVGRTSHLKKFSTISCVLKQRLSHNFHYSSRANFSSSKVLHSKPTMSDFICQNDSPIIQLDCEDAFNELTEKEKHYAHYLSRACWYGGLIDLIQTSPESPLIFSLLHRLFQSDSVKSLKQTALDVCSFTEDEFLAFLIYTTGILSNLGNYKGFGDSKFVPNLPQEKFEKLLLSSKYASEHSEKLKKLLSKCIDSIYSLKDNECRLGFHSKGTTTYLSKNISEAEMDSVKEFLKKQSIEAWNTRLFKTIDETGRSSYEIRLASVLHTDSEEEKNLLSENTENGHNFVVTRGDYSKLLKQCNENLLLAKQYAANENEERMLEKYVQSFHTGSVNSHKDGSRFWIKDKGPIVESYIGFIETYRDPAGMRGEFEGFVAMVNKKMSAKFANLVDSAERFLPLLPWPSSFEKDKFLQPDFTSLDILTFACSGVPAGICIPNYDEIKQTEGFKNVSLGNIIHVATKEPPNYLNKSDQDLLMSLGSQSFEVTVGLHELLGHGSGKLFKKGKDGNYNFNTAEVLNFETNQKISSWYEDGETYDSIFGALGSPFEECRAECVALYLCDNPDVLRIFGYEGAEAEVMIYTIWLSMALKGVGSLQMYDPKTESWLQAHSQARYAILQVMLEAGDDFVKIEKMKGDDGNPDLLITLDKSKIASVGKPAIGKFLGKLQLFRSTADINSAKEMFGKYSSVKSEDKYPFLDYREIVMARKKPRRMFVQANTFLEDGKVKLQTYESSAEGMIQSWADRFQDETVDDVLEELWEKDKHYF